MDGQPAHPKVTARTASLAFAGTDPGVVFIQRGLATPWCQPLPHVCQGPPRLGIAGIT